MDRLAALYSVVKVAVISVTIGFSSMYVDCDQTLIKKNFKFQGGAVAMYREIRRGNGLVWDEN